MSEQALPKGLSIFDLGADRAAWPWSGWPLNNGLPVHAQANHHALEICGAETGHGVRAIAYCDSAERASAILTALHNADQALKSRAALLEVLSDALVWIGRTPTKADLKAYGEVRGKVIAEIEKAKAA